MADTTITAAPAGYIAITSDTQAITAADQQRVSQDIEAALCPDGKKACKTAVKGAVAAAIPAGEPAIGVFDVVTGRILSGTAPEASWEYSFGMNTQSTANIKVNERGAPTDSYCVSETTELLSDITVNYGGRKVSHPLYSYTSPAAPQCTQPADALPAVRQTLEQILLQQMLLQQTLESGQ